jgi:hypothetical protein
VDSSLNLAAFDVFKTINFSQLLLVAVVKNCEHNPQRIFRMDSCTHTHEIHGKPFVACFYPPVTFIFL